MNTARAQRKPRRAPPRLRELTVRVISVVGDAAAEERARRVIVDWLAGLPAEPERR